MADNFRHPITRTPRQLKVQNVNPGSLIEFSYSGGTSRRKPLVFVLANGYKDKRVNMPGKTVIHGLNLNYLPKIQFLKLKTKTEAIPIAGKKADFDDEERNQFGRLMKLENRYTKMDFEGNARFFLKAYYSSRIKPIVKKHDCYRIYDVKKISNIRGIIYNF